jgi:hypothetical protein
MPSLLLQLMIQLLQLPLLLGEVCSSSKSRIKVVALQKQQQHVMLCNYWQEQLHQM